MLPTAPELKDADSQTDSDIRVELMVNDKAEAFIFHNRDFRKRISWVEYDMDTSKLELIMNDGDIKGFGLPVDPKWGKYLQNAFQIMLVLMDNETGKPVRGVYFPLILHRA